MTVQVIRPAGGRRYGPTALAGQFSGDPRAYGGNTPGVRPAASPAQRDHGAAPALRGLPSRGGPAGLSAAPPRRPASQARAAARRSPVAAPFCPTGSAHGGYRMERWARLAMTLVVMAAVVVGTLTVVLRPAAVPSRYVTVQPGDTLMSIVVRDMPGADPVEAMRTVEALNGMDAAIVEVGTVLRIPR